MIRIKNQKQMELFDPWAYLGLKRRKLLNQSWAGLFQKEILCELPVRDFVPFFDKTFGRPSKELYTVLGVLILQQSLDLTDEETVSQLAFNIQWHYALNITEESDTAKYIAPKTLWNMRSIAVDNQLDSILFDSITNKLALVFKVNTDNQRLDSVHIKSNMQRLGRIRIFSNSIHKFLKNLKRAHKNIFNTIDKDIIDTYFTEKSLSCFAMVKPSKSQKSLASLSKDLFNLVQQFRSCPEVKNMNSFKLLERVLKEQCNLNTTDNRKHSVEVKKPDEIPSDSLQNPSDPDATYSGHKGQGYQVQIMETYTDTEDKNIKAKTLNLITHVNVEQACKSDAHALKPAIESTKVKGLDPKELEADTLYGGDDNYEYAKSQGVDLVSPAKTTRNKKSNDISSFKFSNSGHVTSCPGGHKPLITKKNKSRYAQGFCPKTCSQCPLLQDCPVKAGKRHYYLRYEEKVMRLAKRRAYERTDEFKDRYRWRAGVEATMSEYDKRTGAKRLRVRGFKAVRFAAVLKTIGVNIFRAAAVRRAVKSLNSSSCEGVFSFFRQILFFKEQFEIISKNLLQKCKLIFKSYQYVVF
jgi:hypothetical protein